MIPPKLAKDGKSVRQTLWFSRMGENRGTTVYRPKRVALRLVPKPKGKTP